MGELVFTYGSLKRGYHNHVFLNGSRFILDTITEEAGFEMFPLFGYFPAIARGEYKISGEVYEVPEETLGNLDKLEGEGSYYHRIQVKVEGLDDLVWIYLVEDNSLINNDQRIEFLVETENGCQRWLNIDNFST